MHSTSALLQAGQWQVTTSYRWLYSDRHFSGLEEQTHRKDEHTEVINDSHFLDVTLTRAISRRLWLNLTVPTVYSDRSSLYEHMGNSSGQRFSTQAGGIGDLRVSANYWMFDLENQRRSNVLLGFGFKAPTGDYKATDTFHRPTGLQERYVDSSIQPGDGGWGLVFDAQGYHRFSERTTAYATVSYLANPREMVEATGFSVPDSYLYRAGVDYLAFPMRGVTVSLGGRMEGVPEEDLWGGSNGRRRPGYSIAIEPGFTYANERHSLTVSVPIALIRNRTQSIPEIPRGRHGDAAFADYTLNASYSYRF
ncbi:transporter [Pelagicoccus sp. SDUM812003]|uniref:transporter n=1 Tax=Pelagicoccus sp. SDUM812003 TaxID=3041267 RepID=UPI00280C72D1|nr:transporter [Pelagicoccus sp. SDUM812003]MDQ8204583.1 hypothetical protein [Pelagicoccus sp. SDUM812003]